MAAAMPVFAVVFVFRVRLCVLALLAVFAVTMFAMAVFTVTVLTVTMFAMAALAVTMFTMAVFTMAVFTMAVFTMAVLTVLAVGIARRDHAGAGVFLSATAVQVVHGAMPAAAGAILHFCHTCFLPSKFFRYRNIISSASRYYQGT